MSEVDFAEFLQEQGRSWASSLHQFRLAARPDSLSVHAFFEGDEDRLFYMAEIRRVFESFEVVPYSCGGKANVVKVRAQLMKDGYDLSGVIFFVDRDFDDYLGCQVQLDIYTYITDSYSIENQLACSHVVKVIITDFTGLTNGDAADAISCWEAEYMQFARAMKPLMALSIAARSVGVRPNYNNANLAKIIAFDRGRWRRKPGGSGVYMRQTIATPCEADRASLKNWLDLISGDDPSKCLRGKFAFWFLQAFMKRWVRKVDWRLKKQKQPTALISSNLFAFVGGRCRPPESLVAFLKARHADFSKSRV